MWPSIHTDQRPSRCQQGVATAHPCGHGRRGAELADRGIPGEARVRPQSSLVICWKRGLPEGHLVFKHFKHTEGSTIYILPPSTRLCLRRPILISFLTYRTRTIYFPILREGRKGEAHPWTDQGAQDHPRNSHKPRCGPTVPTKLLIPRTCARNHWRSVISDVQESLQETEPWALEAAEGFPLERSETPVRFH